MSVVLYDLHQNLLDALEYGVDPETGELLSDEELSDKLNELEVALDDKLEGIALYSVNMEYDIEKFDKEIEKLESRKERLIKKQASLKRYLENYLLNNGKSDGFKTTRVEVKFRKSTKLKIVDESKVPSEYIKTTTKTDIDKAGIKKMLTELDKKRVAKVNDMIKNGEIDLDKKEFKKNGLSMLTQEFIDSLQIETVDYAELEENLNMSVK